MNNSILIDYLKSFTRTEITLNKERIRLSPTVNISKLYILYRENRKYSKLHYLYLYWINLSLVGKL